MKILTLQNLYLDVKNIFCCLLFIHPKPNGYIYVWELTRELMWTDLSFFAFSTENIFFNLVYMMNVRYIIGKRFFFIYMIRNKKLMSYSKFFIGHEKRLFWQKFLSFDIIFFIANYESDGLKFLMMFFYWKMWWEIGKR